MQAPRCRGSPPPPGGYRGAEHPQLARLRARHLPYAIGIAERDQWMACMIQAMQEQAVDEALAQRLAEAFFGTAVWMRNKGG